MGEVIIYMLGAGFILWCIGDGVVRIIRAANDGGKQHKRTQANLADLEEDLADARKRIEVLEAIVTDGRLDLRRQIDDLTGS